MIYGIALSLRVENSDELEFSTYYVCSGNGSLHDQRCTTNLSPIDVNFNK